MSKNIDDGTISMFIHAIDECEYNRYAPGDIKGNMNQTFEAAMSAIIKIENTLRGVKKHGGKDFCYVYTPCYVYLSRCCNKENADDEYKKVIISRP